MSSLSNRLERGRWYSWFFWAAASSFFLYEFFVRVMPSVILTDLSEQLNATPIELSSALAFYLWIYAPMQLIVGGLFDRFGTKFLLIGAAIIVAAGSFVFADAHGLAAVGLSRGLAGFGSAFAFIGAIYVATVWFSPSRLALIAGMTTAVGMLGEVIGQTPMSAAVAAFGWREVVHVAGWCGVVIAVVILVVVPPRPKWFHDRFTEEDEVDFGIIHGIRMVLSRWQLWVIGLICAILYLPLSVVAAMWGNTFMETTGGFTSDQASFATVMLAVGWLVGCPLTGVISDRIGSRRIPLLAGSIGGGIAMTLLLWPNMFGYWGLLSIMLVGGIMTSTQAICFAVAMELSPKALRGTAAACTNFICMLIAAGIQIMIGWVLTSMVLAPNGQRTAGHTIETANMLQNATPEQFRWAMAIVPALFIVSIVLCLILPETAPPRKTSSSATP